MRVAAALFIGTFLPGCSQIPHGWTRDEITDIATDAASDVVADRATDKSTADLEERIAALEEVNEAQRSQIDWLITESNRIDRNTETLFANDRKLETRINNLPYSQ